MTYRSYFWKKAPFLRILLPLIAGILLQWYCQAGWRIWVFVFTSGITSLCILFFIPFFNRFRLQWLNGFSVMIIFISLGAVLAWLKDIRHGNEWFAKFYKEGTAVLVTLDEPLVEKKNSFKANASISGLISKDGQPVVVMGRVIIYFKKDSSLKELNYGSQIITTKQMQEIKNSGNPGGFDYKRYCLFKGISHQVYLKPGEFTVLPGKNTNQLRQFIYSTRERVLSIIRRNIPGEKEAGLAQALLIGYKDDLDQSLLQSYTNTGVVHIIAVSGLHLGLIYWLLRKLLLPIRFKKLRWLRPVLIIAGLWLFAMVAGASASVLRSAVMFTCIALGETLSRKSQIYNTMALSAFLLLCYNPYWLWDAGFQLSYAAVLSIVIFLRPIYNWFYIKNKLLDLIWKMNAVTLAAQVLTIPLSIYHFHQFPNYFLLTNLIAVPLSGMILLGEILLCALGMTGPIATLYGKILSWLIWLMNSCIERIERLPFSVWEGLQISPLQTAFLFIFIGSISYWLLEKSKTGLKWGLIVLLAIIALRSLSFIRAEQQKKIIIYNISRHGAVDFVSGRRARFMGDAVLLNEGTDRNFHLTPARIRYRYSISDSLNAFLQQGKLIRFMDKNILWLDEPVAIQISTEKTNIDLLIISKNPKINISQLHTAMNIRQVVTDASVPPWKIQSLKKECDSLHIPFHDVKEKGAYLLHL